MWRPSVSGIGCRAAASVLLLADSGARSASLGSISRPLATCLATRRAPRVRGPLPTLVPSSLVMSLVGLR